MTIYLLNFATDKFLGNQKVQNYSANKFGIVNTISLNDDWLKNTDFFNQNKKIFSIKKGFGLWIWKPFIILDTLSTLNYGDILFYLDADFYIIDRIEPLIKICMQKNVLLFRGRHMSKKWIKRDCFCVMECDTPDFYNLPILCAGMNFWKKTDGNIIFLQEWLSLCQNFHLISDNPSEMPELSEFVAHRHDQAILTLLATKHRIEAHRNPAIAPTMLHMDNSNYGVIFKQQSKRIGNNTDDIDKEIKLIGL